MISDPIYIYNFESKEDFDKYFFVEKNSIYPGDRVMPKKVVEVYEDQPYELTINAELIVNDD